MVFGASFTPKNRHVDDVRQTRRESVYKILHSIYTSPISFFSNSGIASISHTLNLLVACFIAYSNSIDSQPNELYF